MRRGSVRVDGTGARAGGLPAADPHYQLLTVEEAAARLGVQPTTLYQWAYQRRIAKVKVNGRALRFRLSTILRLIDDGEYSALGSST
jgi:excisionase family DNA binding protein